MPKLHSAPPTPKTELEGGLLPEWTGVKAAMDRIQNADHKALATWIDERLKVTDKRVEDLSAQHLVMSSTLGHIAKRVEEVDVRSHKERTRIFDKVEGLQKDHAKHLGEHAAREAASSPVVVNSPSWFSYLNPTLVMSIGLSLAIVAVIVVLVVRELGSENTHELIQRIPYGQQKAGGSKPADSPESRGVPEQMPRGGD